MLLRTKRQSLARAEEGVALVEGILTLMLFLPVWMFIIYVGNAGYVGVDGHQAARQSLLKRQARQDCIGGSAVDLSATTIPPGAIGAGSGSATFSVDEEQGTAAVGSYAAMMGQMGFPTSVSRVAVAGCASYPDPSEFSSPGLTTALRQVTGLPI